MNGFRVLAIAYALVVLLIAPSGLGADTLVADDPPPAAEAPGDAPLPVVDPPPPAEPATTVSEEPKPEEEAAAADKPVDSVPEEAPEDKRPVAKASASGSVTITDFEFTPATITVNEGDTVTWTNKGPTLHTATAEDGSFDTGNLDKGEKGSATFTSAGTIPYICTPHPFMKGKVVVKAAAARDDDSGSGDETGDGATGTAGDDDSGSGDDDDGLPATGFETLLIALLGLATLGAGLVLRRRAT